MTSKNSKKDTRVRNYATVVYPESVVENWKDILTNLHIPVFISPLHDKDINPTGEPKKAHYHVVFMFGGKKSIEQIKAITDEIGAVGQEPISSIRGYARYLCHLDNPEKAQYKTDDVVCLSGADYSDCIGLPTDKYKAIKEMMTFCKEYNIESYHELLEIAAEEHYDWFRVLCDNGTIVLKEYLKSKTWAEIKANE